MLSSRGEIEQFKESLIWKDILEELNTIVSVYSSDREKLPSSICEGKISADMLSILTGRYDGTIKAFEWVRDKMLEEMLSDLELKQQTKEEPSEGTEENK